MELICEMCGGPHAYNDKDKEPCNKYFRMLTNNDPMQHEYDDEQQEWY